MDARLPLFLGAVAIVGCNVQSNSPVDARVGGDLVSAQQLIAKGDVTGAAAVLGQLLEESPDDVEALTLRGELHLRMREYREADLYFSRLIEQRKGNLSEIYCSRGIARNGLQQNAEALADFELAVQADPRSSKAYAYRGVSHARIEDYQQAHSDFEEALRLDPNSARAYRNRGLVHYRIGNHVAALEDLSRAIELDPANADAFQYRSAVYLKRERMLEALVDARKAIVLEPNHANHHLQLSSAYKAQQQPEAALAAVVRAVELDRRDCHCLKNRATLLIAQGRLDEAMQDWETAIDLSPGVSEVYLDRALARFVFFDDPSGSQLDLDRATELAPMSAKTYYRRAQLANLQSDFNRSLAELCTSIWLLGQWPCYLEQTAQNFRNGDKSFATDELLSHNLNGALALLKLQSEQTPDDEKLVGSMVILNALAGENSAAIELCNQLIAKQPSDYRAFVVRGELKLANADFEAAQADFEAALELHPFNAAVHAYLGLANYQATNNSEFALICARRAFRLDDRCAIAHLLQDHVDSNAGEVDSASSESVAKQVVALAKRYELQSE